MSGVRITDGVAYVCDRAFPWAEVDVEDADDWHTRRFRLKFENGWTLSVVWGVGTYSTNHRAWRGDGDPFEEEAQTVEIACWTTDGSLRPWRDGDTVCGWVPVDRLLLLIDQMMAWPSTVPDDFVASVPEMSA